MGCSCAIDSNFRATSPYAIPEDFAGPFTRYGTAVELTDITDGLSKTIFVGEVRPLCSWHNGRGWATSNNGNGFSTTLIPINYDSCYDDHPDGCRRPCNYNTELGFKSSHPGGAHFLLGDGSAHFINEAIDMELYQDLGDKADGDVVELDF
jgi:hypothetical protein